MDPGLPGAEMIAGGLADLARGTLSPEALLVLIGAPRLRALGIDVPLPPPDFHPEHALYELLSTEDPATAHSRYNAAVRRLVSFERALACAR